jgi:hypothetical protein
MCMGASVEEEAEYAVSEVAGLWLEVSNAYSSYTTIYLFTVSIASCFCLCLDRSTLPLFTFKELTWTQTALRVHQDV